MEIPNPNLPLEIMLEILIRLPIKSLLRFRCVSKSWRSLISDTQFVKSHLNRSLVLNHRKVFLSAGPLKFIVCNALLCIDDDDDDDDDAKSRSAAIELDYSWENANRLTIVGSCNGLICLLVDTSRILIFNPSTRNFKELPPPPVVGGFNPRHQFFYGFGCDSSSIHNYKVVRAPNYYGARYIGNTQFMVFSLKENSWRTLNLSHVGTFVEDVGTSLNGAIHWLGVRGTSSDRVNVILTLDLSEEVFLEMPRPSPDNVEVFRLGVLEGCLYVLSDNLGFSFDLWMMRDDGFRSWNKFITIPRVIGNQFIEYLEPLCFLKNGEVLLNIDGKELAIYNNEENTCTSIEIHGYPNWFGTALYVESLLSPDGGYVNGQQ